VSVCPSVCRQACSVVGQPGMGWQAVWHAALAYMVCSITTEHKGAWAGHFQARVLLIVIIIIIIIIIMI